MSDLALRAPKPPSLGPLDNRHILASSKANSMLSIVGAMIILLLALPIPVNLGSAARARCSFATSPSVRNRLMRLANSISKLAPPSNLRKVRLGSAQEITRLASMTSPPASSTPVTRKPLSSPTTVIRSTAVFRRNSAPATVAAPTRALTRPATPPAGMACIPPELQTS